MCPPGVYLIALIDTSPKAIHDHLEWELLGSRTKLRVACLMTLRIPNTFNYKLHMGGYSTRKPTTRSLFLSRWIDEMTNQSFLAAFIHTLPFLLWDGFVFMRVELFWALKDASGNNELVRHCSNSWTFIVYVFR